MGPRLFYILGCMQNPVILLQERGIRPSIQRVEVLRYLMGVTTHPSVDTIYQALQEQYPNMSRTTVYNTLELLDSKGLVLTLDFGEGFLRYDATTEPHSHFMCNACGQVTDIFESPKDCESMLPKGYVLKGAALYLHGLCNHCAQKK